MEVTIIKKMFLNEIEIDVPDDATEEQIKEAVEKVIEDNPYPEDWSQFNWQGQQEYEVYDTYTGCDILTLSKD